MASNYRLVCLPNSVPFEPVLRSKYSLVVEQDFCVRRKSFILQMGQAVGGKREEHHTAGRVVRLRHAKNLGLVNS